MRVTMRAKALRIAIAKAKERAENGNGRKY
jgi:hypothetical protein